MGFARRFAYAAGAVALLAGVAPAQRPPASLADVIPSVRPAEFSISAAPVAPPPSTGASADTLANTPPTGATGADLPSSGTPDTASGTGTAGPGPRGTDYLTKNITVFLGGRAQLDFVDYALPAVLRQNIPGTNPLVPGVSFRRLRLDASGTILQNTDYMIQVDFVNGLVLGPGGPKSTDVAVPTDAWFTFKDLPIVGNVRVGNQKPLYSFEHLSSSRYLNFLERSLAFDAFAEGFNNGFEPGISVFDNYLDKRGWWGIGLMKNTRRPFGFGVGTSDWDLNGRVTYLPLDREDGLYLIHVGLGSSYRGTDSGQVRFRARFDARNSPSALSAFAADTGLFNAPQQQLLIPEFAAVFGPLSLQSEFYGSWANNASTLVNNQMVPLGTVYFWSWYAEAHFFLTGEHRAYNRSSGTFGAVKPLRPLEWGRSGFRGWGAWQVTARYTYLDLNDKAINGGRANDLTVGLNWFFNQYMKVQWNYFLTERQGNMNTASNGYINGFATRLALDF